MAATWTVTGANYEGGMRFVYGTFTTASGDSTLSLTSATHGLNHIADYNVTLDTGAVGVQTPKVTVSSGTLTIVYDDTQGYSGKWSVKGR